MWIPFIFETAHFALNFFGSIVAFAIFWLYFDGWRVRRNRDEWPFLIGYILLAISFIIHATAIEDVLLRQSVLEEITSELPLLLFALSRIAAFILIMTGLLLDPLPQRPTHEKDSWWSKPIATSKPRALMLSAGFSLSLLAGIAIALPILSGIIGWLYWRRATTGLERHLRPIGQGFFVLAASELLGLAHLWREGTIVGIYTLTAPFGPVWIVEHILLLIAIIILGRWVWQYLLKRFFSQLFMIFTAFTVTTFLIMTLVFTGMLLHNMRQSALHQLATDTRVLTLALDSKKDELLSAVKSFTQRNDIATAVDERNASALQSASEDFLIATKESTLVVVTSDGEVIARGEDGSAVHSSLSENPLVQAALKGESVVSVVQAPGVLAPEIQVHAVSPITRGTVVVGVAVLGATLDNAFVDGVKAATGLDATIYSDATLSATTIKAADGTSRWVGITEEDASITSKVLSNNQEYTGTVTLLHAPYFAAYLPLHSSDGKVIGMLFAGQPQLALWQTVGRSIELIYFLVAFLGVASLIPAFFVARYIAFQVR